MIKVMVSVSVFVATTAVTAQPVTLTPNEKFYQVQPATVDCVIEAAARQQVPANVLLAISSQEGGRNGQFVRNTNGSYDIGHFQINTVHFRKTWPNLPITRQDVAWRGCYNAELAAWILNQAINSHSELDYWTRVAGYHSFTPLYNARYRQRIIRYAHAWTAWLESNRPQLFAQN